MAVEQAWTCLPSPQGTLSTLPTPSGHHHQQVGNRLQLISDSKHGLVLIWAASEIQFHTNKCLHAQCAWAGTQGQWEPAVPWLTVTVTGCPQRLPSRDGADEWFPTGTRAWGHRPWSGWSLRSGKGLTSPSVELLFLGAWWWWCDECTFATRCDDASPGCSTARARAEPGLHVGVCSFESRPEGSSALCMPLKHLWLFEGSNQKIPRTEEPGRIQSLRSHRVEHNWVTDTFTAPRKIKYQAENLDVFFFPTSQGHSWELFWTLKTPGLTLARLHLSCCAKFA